MAGWLGGICVGGCFVWGEFWCGFRVLWLVF